MGSRGLYARASGGPDYNDRFGPDERAFIFSRDSFYVASVSETGWPYVQFRGGPPGFLRVLDEKTLGFADFRGNRQYLTTGNVATDDRVSLFLMDYVHRRRLKIFGRMRAVATGEDPRIASELAPANYPAVIERAFLITLDAFNWNCPQHITPRYTEVEFANLVGKIPTAPLGRGQGTEPNDSRSPL